MRFTNCTIFLKRTAKLLTMIKRLTYLEEKLDQIFFKLYGLDYDEVKILDPDSNIPTPPH